MKKYIILALALVAMAGCTKNESDLTFTEAVSPYAQFTTTTSIGTKLSADCESWITGDKVGISLVDYDYNIYSSNVPYSVLVSGTDVSFDCDDLANKILTPTADGTYYFNAYYPYSEHDGFDEWGDKYTYVNIDDQSDLSKIDFLMAYCSYRVNSSSSNNNRPNQNTSSTSIEFEFYHMLAKVVVNLSSKSTGPSSYEGLEIKFADTYNGFTYYPEWDSFDVNDDYIGDITLYPTVAGDGLTASVTGIVVPYSFQDLDIEFTVGGKDYSYTFSISDSYLYSGYVYTLNLVVGDDLVEMADDYTITPWDEYTTTALPDFEGYQDGTAEYPYAISSAEELKAMALDKYYILTNDINLEDLGEEWTPIGTDIENTFTGGLDGNNKTISGLEITDRTANYTGLFGYTRYATIKDLTISGDVSSSSSKYTAILVGSANYSTLENITVSGTLSTSNYYGGLLAGDAYYSTVTNITASGTISASGEETAIAIGKAENSTVTNVTASGSITSENGSIAGVVGQAKYTTVESCHNSATVSGTYRVGGVVGKSENSSLITNSSNSAKITATSYVGGIAGMALDIDVVNCENRGDVDSSSTTSSHSAGGIVGYYYITSAATSIYYVVNCANYASVTTVKAYAGGIVGDVYIDSSTDYTIAVANCYNEGAISQSSANSSCNAGGIVANNNATIYISNCYNKGEVAGYSDSGTYYYDAISPDAYSALSAEYNNYYDSTVDGAYHNESNGSATDELTDLATTLNDSASAMSSDLGSYTACQWSSETTTPIIF